MTRLTPLGQQRLLEIVGRITQRPETWDQSEPRPNTDRRFCIFCHATIDALGRDPLDNESTRDIGGAWFGFTFEPAMDWLFCPDRTLAELQRAAIEGEVPNG